jgi:pyridoxal phosphate enzyme (YggS family)
MSITKNLTQIIENINNAINRTSNTSIDASKSVKLVAVTKNHDVTAVQEAIASGVIAIGENRIQEAANKAQMLGIQQIEWHLIGHLQRNKVRQAVEMFDLIHSVDSEKLASEINRIAGIIGKRQDVLIQVNMANEETKFGIASKDTLTLGKFISNLEHVRLCGLMTIAPFYEDIELSRPIFRNMYELFKELQDTKFANTNIQWLSMGMTNDYIVGVEEGSNLVRIGTGIFGQRQY